jgi:hypothetical protein
MKRHLHIVAIAAVAGAIAAGAMQTLFSAYAVQNELVPPTPESTPGRSSRRPSAMLSARWRAATRGQQRRRMSAARPSTVCAGSMIPVSPWLLKRYVNGAWAVEGARCRRPISPSPARGDLEFRLDRAPPAR